MQAFLALVDRLNEARAEERARVEAEIWERFGVEQALLALDMSQFSLSVRRSGILPYLGLIRRMSMFAGFCYTQFADTYQERNGLLYGDRRPKIPIDDIAVATRGARTTRQLQEDHPRQGLAADLDVDLDAETP